jgi:hypothetical protein
VGDVLYSRCGYAVILALCGLHSAAAIEMPRLTPYLEGHYEMQRSEVENQSQQIAFLALRNSYEFLKKEGALLPLHQQVVT